MPRGVRTPEHIQRRIEYLYIEQRLKGPAIEKRLQEDGITLKDGVDVPLRTISDHISKILKQYPVEEQRLDSPWQLRPPMRIESPSSLSSSESDRTSGIAIKPVVQYSSELPDGLTREDAKVLLELKRQVGFRGQKLTIRIARWVSVLKSVKKWSSDYELYVMARLYAERERWAVINDKELDTTDLDYKVSFSDDQSYRRAVEMGNVRGIDAVAYLEAMFLGQALIRSEEPENHVKVLSLIRNLQELSEAQGDRPNRLMRILQRVPKESFPDFFDSLEEIIESGSPMASADDLAARLEHAAVVRPPYI